MLPVRSVLRWPRAPDVFLAEVAGMVSGTKKLMPAAKAAAVAAKAAKEAAQKEKRDRRKPWRARVRADPYEAMIQYLPAFVSVVQDLDKGLWRITYPGFPRRHVSWTRCAICNKYCYG